VLNVQSIPPQLLIGSLHRLHALLGKTQAPVPMAGPREISLAGLNQLLFGVLANRQVLSTFTAVSGAGTASAYDFSTLGTVVDVGGSEGQLLMAILERYSHLRGILFDRPAAVSSARALLVSAGVADRCSIVTGSFFESIPSGGDAYILRHILHDWSDERCVAILRVCRGALAPKARLLIIERTLVENAQIAMSVLHADLEMLVLNGGQERTQAQYARLVGDAGFRLTNVVATGEEPPHNIYEAMPA